MKNPTFLACLLFLLVSLSALSQQPDVLIYDQALVPDYELPPLLQLQGGKPVTSRAVWEKQKKAELMRFFAGEMFGKTPEQALQTTFRVIDDEPKALNGKAHRKQIAVVFSNGRDSLRMDILLYLPAGAAQPVPVFLGLNFFGNHTIHPDPAIRLNTNWMRQSSGFGVVNNRATESGRGVRVNRWPVEAILDRGYGLATIYCGDLDPDRPDFSDGLQPLFYTAGQQRPAADEWGTIGAWAWGMSRTLDYFEQDGQVDHQRVISFGHSRLGKTALWAGAQDERFALVISNNSGCGGAALSRRRFGEKVSRINTAFPHWFCENYKQYNHNEAAMPTDQHGLLALIAPRPLYVASASEDLWADPYGEFLSARGASVVCEKIYGLQGLSGKPMPLIGQPLNSGSIGYHLRRGKHHVTAQDWQWYMDFADSHLKPGGRGQ